MSCCHTKFSSSARVQKSRISPRSGTVRQWVTAASSAVVVTLLLFAPSTWAGDKAEVGFTGFSGDGKIFIFEEFGIGAGSNQPFAHLFFVDTESGREVIPAVRARGKKDAFSGRSFFEERSGLLTLRGKNWSYAERALKADADVDGATPAAALMSWSGPRLVSETTGDRRQRVAFGPKLKRKQSGDKKTGDAKRRFELKLATKNLAPDKADAAGCSPFAVEVVVTDFKTKKAATLLNEKRPASSRGCTTRAEIYGIWVAKGRIAVVIAFERPGFEGNDTRHFVVAGRIP